MGDRRTDRAVLDQVARDLIDKGLLIEAGFAALRAQAMHLNAPPDQVRQMRLAFFAGAQHVFASIMQMLDPGTDPTEADVSRMDKIAAELQAFAEQWTAAHGPFQ